MSAAVKPQFSAAEFFAWEAEQLEKHEFYYGEVFSVAGGTPEHALLGANALVELGSQLLGGPCRAFSSDLAVELDPDGRFCYPDATIVCGTVERSEHGPAAVNPTVVIEVLSKSPAAYDRGDKADSYRRLPSVQAIVFIESTRVAMSALVRDGDRWMAQDTDADGRLALDCLPRPTGAVGAALSIEAVYDGLDLPDVPVGFGPPSAAK